MTDVAQRILALFDDHEFFARVANNCRDPCHDDRWCGTCATRADGIEDFIAAVKREIVKEMT